MGAKDKQARIIISISLSDDIFEDIRGCTSSEGMLNKIGSVLRFRTQLDKTYVPPELRTV